MEKAALVVSVKASVAQIVLTVSARTVTTITALEMIVVKDVNMVNGTKSTSGKSGKSESVTRAVNVILRTVEEMMVRTVAIVDLEEEEVEEMAQAVILLPLAPHPILQLFRFTHDSFILQGYKGWVYNRRVAQSFE